MMQGDDQVTRAVAGDAEALGNLLLEHGPTLVPALVTRIPPRFRSVLSAEDALQEAYTQAFQSISTLRYLSRVGFRNWLGSLARHALLDALRMLRADKRGGGRAALSLDDETSSLLNLRNEVTDGLPTPSRAAARHEAVLELRVAIRALPEEYREVLTCYDLEHRAIEEVASRLKRSVGAVFMVRARALARLRVEMGSASRYLSEGRY